MSHDRPDLTVTGFHGWRWRSSSVIEAPQGRESRSTRSACLVPSRQATASAFGARLMRLGLRGALPGPRKPAVALGAGGKSSSRWVRVQFYKCTPSKMGG